MTVKKMTKGKYSTSVSILLFSAASSMLIEEYSKIIALEPGILEHIDNLDDLNKVYDLLGKVWFVHVYINRK